MGYYYYPFSPYLRHLKDCIYGILTFVFNHEICQYYARFNNKFTSITKIFRVYAYNINLKVSRQSEYYYVPFFKTLHPQK